MALNFLNLSENVRDKLLKANLTTSRQILLLTEVELQTIGNFNAAEIKNIFYLASQSIIKPISVKEDLPTITTGCKQIDNILGGGFRCCSGINELSGESGCGKTQLCLQLTLTAQNPKSLGGIDKSVVYICTEDNFPSKRLLQLMENIPAPFKSRHELSYGDRIYVEHISDVNGLKGCLFERLPKLLSTGKIGLLIIDSIAALFRGEYKREEGLQRTKDLRAVGCQLHSLSKKYCICILCVNQVAAAVSSSVEESVPALGLAWANLVTTRIIMKKHQFRNYKEMELIFSPHSAPANCKYIITESGIKAL